MDIEELIRVSSHQADMYGTQYEICIRDAMLRLRAAEKELTELRMQYISAVGQEQDNDQIVSDEIGVQLYEEMQDAINGYCIAGELPFSVINAWEIIFKHWVETRFNIQAQSNTDKPHVTQMRGVIRYLNRNCKDDWVISTAKEMKAYIELNSDKSLPLCFHNTGPDSSKHYTTRRWPQETNHAFTHRFKNAMPESLINNRPPIYFKTDDSEEEHF